MGNLQPGLGDLGVSVEKQVEIERPRPPRRNGRTVAPEASLDGQEQVEKLPRRAVGLERRNPVQEPWLVQVADRLRIDERGEGYDLDPLRGPELRHR
jgi:hypothetical protein